MDNDDKPVGRLLTRREMLVLLGTVSAAALVRCAPGQSASNAITTATATTAPATTAATVAGATTAPTATTAAATASATSAATAAAASVAIPACVVRPELTEGPYFVDGQLNRTDIRSDPATGVVSDGIPLALTFRVTEITDACVPLAGAMVDVWHCDVNGVYSGVQDPGFSTAGQQFLRGYQVTDENGAAQFTTIYPGWYPGRTVHIHFKIRSAAPANQTYEFTSQLFFDDAFTDQVYQLPPYNTRGARSPRNEGDGIYGQSAGLLTLDVTGSADGYAAVFDIGLQTG